mmetsp:Transcript_37243/g.96659  ORF Transcript_37243/g.96659 Transcript_37243/m.96659 type:complete len:256 (-) Transcript_37243:153-920(-)
MTSSTAAAGAAASAAPGEAAAKKRWIDCRPATGAAVNSVVDSAKREHGSVSSAAPNSAAAAAASAAARPSGLPDSAPGGIGPERLRSLPQVLPTPRPPRQCSTRFRARRWCVASSSAMRTASSSARMPSHRRMAAVLEVAEKDLAASIDLGGPLATTASAHAPRTAACTHRARAAPNLCSSAASGMSATSPAVAAPISCNSAPSLPPILPILVRGRLRMRAATARAGMSVCWLGLCIAEASLASSLLAATPPDMV